MYVCSYFEILLIRDMGRNNMSIKYRGCCSLFYILPWCTIVVCSLPRAISELKQWYQQGSNLES